MSTMPNSPMQWANVREIPVIIEGFILGNKTRKNVVILDLPKVYDASLKLAGKLVSPLEEAVS